MNETIVVEDGQAAVATTAVSGTLSPASSATDTIAIVDTPSGKQAALKVYNLNGGGGGGGASLPDQTGNAGKFLTTDGTTASWGSALVNKSAYPDTNIILLGKRPNYGDGQNSNHVIIGLDATVSDSASYAVSIGWSASASSYAVAVGAEAKASTRAMQFGSGTNNDTNTVKFSNSNGNFEMMDADGNVPLERLTYVTNQIGDISTALTAILGE